MSFSRIDLELSLLVGCAVFLVFACIVAVIAFTHWRRASVRDAERVTAQMDATTQRLGEIEAGLALLDSRLAEIARQLEGPMRAPAAPASSASPSYPIAIRLARNGATCEELMEACGLGRQEAELVKRLHGPAKRGTRAHTAAA